MVGGGGAVGFAAIQLAVAAGCHVSTTCGDESIDRLLAAGVEQAVDYTAEVGIRSLLPCRTFCRSFDPTPSNCVYNCAGAISYLFLIRCFSTGS